MPFQALVSIPAHSIIIEDTAGRLHMLFGGHAFAVIRAPGLCVLLCVASVSASGYLFSMGVTVEDGRRSMTVKSRISEEKRRTMLASPRAGAPDARSAPGGNPHMIDQVLGRSQAAHSRMSSLRRSETFVSLTEFDVAMLAEVFHERSSARHAVVFSAGDRGESVFLIKRGFVRLHRPMASGREVSFGIIGPGDLLGGEAAIQNDATRTATASALTGITYFAASAASVARLMRRSPALTLCLTRETLRRREELETRLAIATFASVRSRIEYALAQLALAHGTRDEDGTMRLPARLTHQDIASLAGTYRETASLALGDLRREGRMRLDASGALCLVNPERMLGNALGTADRPASAAGDGFRAAATMRSELASGSQPISHSAAARW